MLSTPPTSLPTGRKAIPETIPEIIPGVVSGVIPGILEDVLGIILVKLDTLSRRNLAETSKAGVETVPRILSGIPRRKDALGRPKTYKIARAESRRYKEIALHGRASELEPPTRSAEFLGYARACVKLGKYPVFEKRFLRYIENDPVIYSLMGKHNTTYTFGRITWGIYMDTNVIDLIRRGHPYGIGYSHVPSRASSWDVLCSPVLFQAVAEAMGPRAFESGVVGCLLEELCLREECEWLKNLAKQYPAAYSGFRDSFFGSEQTYGGGATRVLANHPSRYVFDLAVTRVSTRKVCAIAGSGAIILGIYEAKLVLAGPQEVSAVFARMYRMASAPEDPADPEISSAQYDRRMEFVEFVLSGSLTATVILEKFTAEHPREAADWLPGRFERLTVEEVCRLVRTAGGHIPARLLGNSKNAIIYGCLSDRDFGKAPDSLRAISYCLDALDKMPRGCQAILRCRIARACETSALRQLTSTARMKILLLAAENDDIQLARGIRANSTKKQFTRAIPGGGYPKPESWYYS